MVFLHVMASVLLLVLVPWFSLFVSFFLALVFPIRFDPLLVTVFVSLLVSWLVEKLLVAVFVALLDRQLDMLPYIDQLPYIEQFHVHSCRLSMVRFFRNIQQNHIRIVYQKSIALQLHEYHVLDIENDLVPQKLWYRKIVVYNDHLLVHKYRMIHYNNPM